MPILVRRRPHRDAPIVPRTAAAAATPVVPLVVAAAAVAVAAVDAHPVVAVSVIIHVRQVVVVPVEHRVVAHVMAPAQAVALHSVYQAAKLDAQDRASARALHLARRRVAMDVTRHADPLANTKERPPSYEVR